MKETKAFCGPTSGVESHDFEPTDRQWHFAPNRQLWGTEERAHVRCRRCGCRTWISRAEAKKHGYHSAPSGA